MWLWVGVPFGSKPQPQTRPSIDAVAAVVWYGARLENLCLPVVPNRKPSRPPTARGEEWAWTPVRFESRKIPSWRLTN